MRHVVTYLSSDGAGPSGIESFVVSADSALVTASLAFYASLRNWKGVHSIERSAAIRCFALGVTRGREGIGTSIFLAASERAMATLVTPNLSFVSLSCL